MIMIIINKGKWLAFTYAVVTIDHNTTTKEILKHEENDYTDLNGIDSNNEWL